MHVNDVTLFCIIYSTNIPVGMLGSFSIIAHSVSCFPGCLSPESFFFGVRSWLGWDDLKRSHFVGKLRFWIVLTLIVTITRGAVAEWVRESTADQTVEGSSPTSVKTFSLRNFGNSVYPALPVSFG